MDSKPKILIVDDEEAWRNLIKDVLKKKKYDIMTAASGNRAIELIEKNDFHVIITDMRMESEYRGIEVLEYVKQNYPFTPVIILTAFGTIETAKDALKKEAFDFFIKGDKNSANEELRKKVAEALKKRKYDEEKGFDEMVSLQFPCFFSDLYDKLKHDIDPTEKLNTQIFLFELILKFSFSVLISEYLYGPKRISNIDALLTKEKISRPVMGILINIIRELYKIEKEFPDNFYLAIFSNLFKDKNIKLMENFIKIRNRWAHVGTSSNYECKNLVDTCNDILLTLFRDLIFLTDFLLCKIEWLKLTRDQKIYNLIECTGANINLLPSKKNFKTLLFCDEVILIHLKNDERYQSLHPFIVLEDCKDCGQKEIFFFNSFSHNKIYYSGYKTSHEFTSNDYGDNLLKLIKGGNC